MRYFDSTMAPAKTSFVRMHEQRVFTCETDWAERPKTQAEYNRFTRRRFDFAVNQESRSQEASDARQRLSKRAASQGALKPYTQNVDHEEIEGFVYRNGLYFRA